MMVVKSNSSSSLPKRAGSMKYTAEDLDYTATTFEHGGLVMSQQTQRNLREKYGYCLSCPRTPVLCFSKKGLFNRMSGSKVPLTIEGECLDGVCLKCNPDKDPTGAARPREQFAALKNINTTVGGSSSSSRSTATSATVSSRSSIATSVSSRSTTSSSIATSSRKDIQRDLSNGSIALSQSRRSNVFNRSSQANSSTGSVGSIGSVGSGSHSSSAGGGRPPIRMMVPSSSPGGNNNTTLSSTSIHSGRGSSSRTGTRRSSTITSPTELNRASSSPIVNSNNSNTTLVVATPPNDVHRAPSSSSFHQPRMISAETLKAVSSQSSLSSTDTTSSNDEPTSTTTTTTTGGGGGGPPSRQASSSSLASLPRSSNHSRRGGLQTVTTIVEETDEQAAKNLDELFDGFMRESAYELLVEQLVSSIQKSSSKSRDAKVVCTCLEWIAKICNKTNPNSKANKQRLITTNVIEETVTAMKSFDSSKDVQIKGAAALAALVVGKKAGREAMVRNGACGLLVKLLKNYKDDATVVEPAISALRVSSNDPKAPSVMVQRGICPLILSTLENFQDSASIMEPTIVLLLALASEPGAQHSLQSSKAIEYVCQSLSKHLSLLPLQCYGCTFLINMMPMENNQAPIVSRQVMTTLIAALRHHKRDASFVTEIACLALDDWTRDSQKNVRTLRTVEGVMDLFEDTDPSNVFVTYTEADEVLMRLQMSTFEDQAQEDQVLQDQLPSFLVAGDGNPEEVAAGVASLLKEYDWSKRVVQECLGFLVSLGGDSDDHLVAIHQEVGTQVLTDLLKEYTSSVEVMEPGCRLLEVLSNRDESLGQELYEAGVTTVLVACLKTNADEVMCVEPALSALQAILSCVEVESWGEQARKEGLEVVKAVMEAKDSENVASCGKWILDRFEDA